MAIPSYTASHIICSLCRTSANTRFLPLYITGSEGINVCHDCEMKIVEFCRRLALENLARHRKLA